MLSKCHVFLSCQFCPGVYGQETPDSLTGPSLLSKTILLLTKIESMSMNGIVFMTWSFPPREFS